MAKLLIVSGLFLTLLGAVIYFFPGLKLGQLPGDLEWSFGKGKVYVPIMTSVVISILLSIGFYLFNKFFN